MNGGFLLDTSVLIALFAAERPVQEKVAGASSIYVPVIAVAELYYGAMASQQVDANVERIDRFVASVEMLGCDLPTALEYGRVKSMLRLAGTPIPENDIWIAALARQHGLVLVSRDVHFRAVQDLALESW